MLGKREPFIEAWQPGHHVHCKEGPRQPAGGILRRAAATKAWPVLALGAVSEAIYLAAALRLSWWRYGGALGSWRKILGGPQSAQGSDAEFRALIVCAAAVAVLAAAYCLGWYSVRRGYASRTVVWSGAAVFSLSLFWLLPATADLFVYLSQSYVFANLGLDPFEPLPASLAQSDRLLQAYQHPYTLNPSVYGPAWILLTAPAGGPSSPLAGGIAYLKGAAVVGFLGCAWLLERLATQLSPARALEALYLFAWNPLVLVTTAGGGHNDIVMMAVVLLAFGLLHRGHWALAWGAMALSVWIKYISLIFVPLVLLFQLQQRRSRALRGSECALALRIASAVLLVSALALAPFGSPTWLLGGLERLLRPANWQLAAPAFAASAAVLGLALFGVAALLLAYRFRREQPSFRKLMDYAFVVSLLAFVLGAARSQPWHLVWPLSLSGLAMRRWAWPVTVGLGFLLLFAQLWVEWGAPGLARAD